MPSTNDATAEVLFDTGLFIGALLKADPRHAEARVLVEAARRGAIRACTTASILSEVYGALTWRARGLVTIQEKPPKLSGF